MSTSSPPPPGTSLVPLPLPPAIAARLPPCPPAGDEPRLHLGADAGLADLRAALLQADASGEVGAELAGLAASQRANRHVPISAAADEGDGADESYAGPDGGAAAGVAANSVQNGGTKRGRDAASGDGQDVQQNNDEDEYEDEEEEEGLLAYHPDAAVMLRNSYAEDNGTTTRGHHLVTTRRILFLSTSFSGGDANDAVIDAGCVVLHALSECDERGWHVYCQLDDGSGGGGGGFGDGGSDDSNGNPDEAYLYPPADGGAEGQQKDACQRMFDAFSALASLNPIYGDADDNAGGGGFFGMMAGMGEMMMGDDGDGGMVMMGGDDADNDEMVCRLGEGINASGGFGPTADAAKESDNGDGGATEEERAAMLERLDGMLVVPAECEIPSGEEENENGQGGGQFDDAEESGDELL